MQDIFLNQKKKTCLEMITRLDKKLRKQISHLSINSRNKVIRQPNFKVVFFVYPYFINNVIRWAIKVRRDSRNMICSFSSTVANVFIWSAACAVDNVDAKIIVEVTATSLSFFMLFLILQIVRQHPSQPLLFVLRAA